MVRYFFLLALPLLLQACATPRAQFVLLPEDDGSVGSIRVENEAGAAEISGAGQRVGIAAAAKAPAERKALTAPDIEKRYGRTLEQLPQTPATFNIYFAPNSSEPAAGAAEAMAEILEEVRRRDSRDVSLNGHTDTVGTPESNMALSLQRADAVQQQLTQGGIPAHYISVEYYGESDPAVPTADEVDEPRNRRVEVVVR